MFKVVLESIQHFGYGVPLSNVYSVYITSTRELKYVADDLMAHCKRLQLQLEPEGKLLTLTYFLTLPEVQLDEVCYNCSYNTVIVSKASRLNVFFLKIIHSKWMDI